MKQIHCSLFVITIARLGVVFIYVVNGLTAFIEVDKCLDSGVRFNYEIELCEL